MHDRVRGGFKGSGSIRFKSHMKECLVGIRHAFVDVSQHVKCLIAEQTFLPWMGRDVFESENAAMFMDWLCWRSEVDCWLNEGL